MNVVSSIALYTTHDPTEFITIFSLIFARILLKSAKICKRIAILPPAPQAPTLTIWMYAYRIFRARSVKSDDVDIFLHFHEVLTQWCTDLSEMLCCKLYIFGSCLVIYP